MATQSSETPINSTNEKLSEIPGVSEPTTGKIQEQIMIP
jgi:hypothetical protein